MLKYLYGLGQTLRLLGLAYGALLSMSHSELIELRGKRRLERRHRMARARGKPTAEDPHVTAMGYWP